jgi:hypothetical protein
MANPTSNFNWQMPTPTDLVTDLPADFEVFGQAVDTSLADLKGGTSGQVLAKNSNTDMDFVWVAQDDSNAIQNAIVDAKGDLIAASANDTPARLAVGADGETLVADSSQATGLRYTAGTVQANPVINSAMQIWQRGTSIALGAGTYTADRWYGYRGVAGSTVTRQVTNDTTNLPFIQYALRLQRDSGNSSTSAIAISNSFESVNSIPYAGKTVTLSFYARAGANFSQASSILTFTLSSGTGTDQNVMFGYTGQATVATTNATLTTTWQRFTVSGTVATTATELGFKIGDFNPVGTAGANDWFEVTGVQVDIGSVALPFRTYAATIQGELAACQRYYWRRSATSPNSVYTPFASGATANATTHYMTVQYPVPMRTAPSSVEFLSVSLAVPGGTGYVPSAVTLANTAEQMTLLTVTTSSSVYTIGQATALNAGNTNNSYLGMSAEL